MKEGFLQGRLYAGIDSLNSAALEWLDKECNGTTHERTRKAPRELFREESKHLEKVQFEDAEVAIRAVSDKYAVVYDWSKYELPHSRVKQFDQIRIEENDGVLIFYKAGTGELIYKCRKPAEEGGDIPYKNDGVKWRLSEKMPYGGYLRMWRISRNSAQKSEHRMVGMPVFKCGGLSRLQKHTPSIKWKRRFDTVSA